jgi:transposase-like protein
MPGHRRKFSPQFKAEAVQMVISTGKPIAVVARDLGIHDGALGELGGRLALRASGAGPAVVPGGACA